MSSVNSIMVLGRFTMTESLANILAQLNYFTDKRYIRLGEPIPAHIVEGAEARLNCTFSNQMRSFFKLYNGIYLIDSYIPGIALEGPSYFTEKDILGADPKMLLNNPPDIVSSNLLNRTFRWWPSNWLEVGQDSFGCYFVADIDAINAIGESKIYWVDHESMGVDDSERKLIADDYFGFLDWTIKQLINRYDRNGNLK